MLDTVNELSPCVEYYSIDEFFFQPHRSHDLLLQAVQARDKIADEVGVPATIAFGRTRTLAKLFSDTAKPFGAKAVIDPDQERIILANLDVSEISGIGSRRAARLAPYGIKTCLDYANADRLLIRHLLTRVSSFSLVGVYLTSLQDRQTLPVETVWEADQ